MKWGLFASIALLTLQAKAGCSIDQLMSTLRSEMRDSGYTYLSDRSGDATQPPAPFEHEFKDMYVFFVDYNGQTFEPILHYPHGTCSNGTVGWVH